jgi:dephospho-CoA kinase
MIIIGLTGSIAMGKSEVAKIFSEQGLPVFDADQEVHKLYDSQAGVSLLETIVPRALKQGKVDRTILSALVLADGSLLDKLETLVHGEISNRRQHFVDTARAHGQAIAIVDMPLLFEKHHEKTVDVTVVVSAPEALQHKRAMLRPAMTFEKLDMILQRQMPDREKRDRADYIIENNGTLEQLKANTLKVLMSIRKVHTL